MQVFPVASQWWVQSAWWAAAAVEPHFMTGTMSLEPRQAAHHLRKEPSTLRFMKKHTAFSSMCAYSKITVRSCLFVDAEPSSVSSDWPLSLQHGGLLLVKHSIHYQIIQVILSHTDGLYNYRCIEVVIVCLDIICAWIPFRHRLIIYLYTGIPLLSPQHLIQKVKMPYFVDLLHMKSFFILMIMAHSLWKSSVWKY